MNAPDTKDAQQIDELFRELGDARKSVQRRAVDELVMMVASGNCTVLERLRELIRGDDPRMRWAAAYTLGQIGGDAFTVETAEALCEAMAADDGDIRWAAANLMVQLGRANRDEVRARLLTLAAAVNRHARKMALYCVRDLAFEGADLLAILRGAARDVDVHVRLAALSVLSRMRHTDNEAVKILIERLHSDPDAGVRRAAASGLGNIATADADAIAALASASADPDESLARAARGALERLEKKQWKKLH